MRCTYSFLIDSVWIINPLAMEFSVLARKIAFFFFFISYH